METQAEGRQAKGRQAKDRQTSDRQAKSAAPGASKRRPPGTLLFLPRFANRTEVIQWLKRIHAWTGFWGALAFLLIGASGMLLNHRATLKIETGAPREVMEANIAVDPALIGSAEDLGRWAQTQFGASLEPRAPRAEGGGPPRGERGGGDRVRMMGADVPEAVVWKQAFNGANGVLTVEYSPGSTAVKA